MKVAEVYYVGRGRRHSRRGPTDQRYSWQRRSSDADADDRPAAVDNVEDALYFDELDVFRVEWSPVGKIVKNTEGPVSEAGEALQNMGYRQKQKLAKSLGIKADGKEEELNERLQPEVDRLKEQMEGL